MEQPGWAGLFSRSWRPEAWPPCSEGQRLGLKTQGLAAQGLLGGLDMWAWHRTSTIRRPLSPKSLPGQYSFVDIRAQLQKSRSRWSPLNPVNVREEFREHRRPRPWSFKCHQRLDYQIPQTSHPLPAQRQAFQKYQQRDARRGFTGHHTGRRDAFLPVLLVTLDLVVRDTETVRSSQQLYDMKPHSEREASVFTSQKAPSELSLPSRYF